MAVAKKAAAKKSAKSTGTAMVNWDEELAKYADKSSAQEDTAASGGGMKWFGTRAGVLTFDDAKLPGNRVAVIIVDGLFEHVYYDGDYDSDNPVPPTCFALGRDEENLEPHPSVVEKEQAQHHRCGVAKQPDCCPHNEFGSADKGKGKANKNIRRLALLPAGKLDKNGNFTLNTDPDHFREAQMAFIKVPVTSTPNYKAYSKQLTTQLRKPTFAVATMISLHPHEKFTMEMKFEALEELPFDLLDAIHSRMAEADMKLFQPYNLDPPDEQSARKPAGRGNARQAASKRTSARPAAKTAAPAKKARKY